MCWPCLSLDPLPVWLGSANYTLWRFPPSDRRRHSILQDVEHDSQTYGRATSHLPSSLCHHHTFLAAPVLTSCFSNCTGAKLSELPRYHLVDLDAANMPWAMPLICCLWVENKALTSTAAALFWYTLYAIPSSPWLLVRLICRSCDVGRWWWLAMKMAVMAVLDAGPISIHFKTSSTPTSFLGIHFLLQQWFRLTMDWWLLFEGLCRGKKFHLL